MNDPKYRVIRRKQKTKAITPYRWVKAQVSGFRAYIADHSPLWWIWQYSSTALHFSVIFYFAKLFPEALITVIALMLLFGALFATISLVERMNEND
jgi:hypothetical protein